MMGVSRVTAWTCATTTTRHQSGAREHGVGYSPEVALRRASHAMGERAPSVGVGVGVDGDADDDDGTTTPMGDHDADSVHTNTENDGRRTRDYARDPPKNWHSKWTWSAVDGSDRATRGPAGRVLFEAPALHERARRGRVDEVRELLDSKTFDVDAKDPAGRTALHFAVGYGREDVVRELLERGCELEPRDDWTKAPVDWGLQAHHAKCIELLRVEAVRRGVYGGKGKVAPLKTYVEHCYGITSEELHEHVAKIAAEAQENNKRNLAKDAKKYDAVRARASLQDKLKLKAQGRKRR